MHPRLQKGACSGASGLPHTGHFFALSGLLGIPARDGKRRIGPQPDCPAELAGESVEPVGLAFEHRDHRRVREGFLTEARRRPQRSKVVDAGAAPEAVQALIQQEVARVLATRPRA